MRTEVHLRSDPNVSFQDNDGNHWQVFEVLDDRLVAGLLLFVSEGRVRATWGSPIAWRSPENLAALFDLARDLQNTNDLAAS
jgi:hypothetical protein